MRLGGYPLFSEGILGKSGASAMKAFIAWGAFYSVLALSGFMLAFLWYYLDHNLQVWLVFVLSGLAVLSLLWLAMESRKLEISVGLLIGSLLPQQLLVRAIRVIEELRSVRERRSPHKGIMTPEDQVSKDDPQIMQVLRHYMSQKRFSEVFDFGSAILNSKIGLPTEAKTKVLYSVGLSAFRIGSYHNSIELLEKALRDSKDGSFTARISATLAGVYLAVDRIPDAEAAAAQSLGFDQSNLPAIYNAVCIASVSRDYSTMIKYARQLTQNLHREAEDSHSELRHLLLTDPHLQNLRNHSAFNELFPQLTSQRTAHRSNTRRIVERKKKKKKKQKK